MTETGKVTLIPNGEVCDVEWKMDFSSFSEAIDVYYRSPDFTFEGEDWYLAIWPNGNKNRESIGYIDLLLIRGYSNGPPINLKVILAFKTITGQKDLERRCTEFFPENFSKLYVHRLISKCNFRKRQFEFLDSGFLSIVCTLKRVNSAEIATAECSHCNDTFDADDISSHEKKCRVKCPDCLAVVLLKNWHYHECQISRAEAFEKLIGDFKEIMTRGDHSDTIIKVKGEEFRLHRNILEARSSYFSSMFNSDMSERNTGIVYVDDCEPNVFRLFILFLYTGRAESISPENVCDLYEVSDKYQEKQLKNECLHFMNNSISIDSFCDYVILAIKHEEMKFLESATKFFAIEAKKIIRTSKWLKFLKEYPVQANEFHIKAFDIQQSLQKK